MQTIPLPQWLMRKASVQRARYGRITKHTAKQINERMAQVAPMQNLGRVMAEQMKAHAEKLRDELHNTRGRAARERVRLKIVRFRAAVTTIPHLMPA